MVFYISHIGLRASKASILRHLLLTLNNQVTLNNSGPLNP